MFKRMITTMNSYRNTFIRNAGISAAATLMLLAGTGRAQDKVNVPLDDPLRPAVIKVSQVSSSIIVKGYEGKEVGVEAKARTEADRRGHRGREGEANTEGMKRINIGATGLSVEEE